MKNNQENKTDLSKTKLVKKEINEKIYQSLVEKSVLGMYIYQDNKLVYINQQYAEIFGYTREELLETNPLHLIHPDDLNFVINNIQKSMNADSYPKKLNYHVRAKKKDGQVIYIEINRMESSIHYNGNHAINGYIMDVTDRIIQEQRLVEANEQVINILESMTDAFYTLDRNWIITYINKAAAMFMNGKREELVGRNLWGAFPDAIQTNYYRQFHRVMKEQVSVHFGDYYEPLKLWTDVRLYPSKDGGISVYFLNITEEKKREEKIRQMAYHDSLTGLPNRNQLLEHLKNIELSTLAVLFLDLDRFKFINDTMGHSFGDLFLKEVSKRLLECVGKDGKIYRHGGDEFIIIMENADKDKIHEVLQRIINGFSVPFLLNEQELFTSTSIGVSLYPFDGNDSDTLIKLADIAMYNAKKQGRNTYVFYSSTLDNKNEYKLMLETALRKALNNSEYSIYYQPQFQLGIDKIVGLEALIRWVHPEWGVISPIEFIPLAEESGLIIPLGKWILENACKQLKNWHNEGFSDLTISVNISPIQFRDKEFVQTVKQVLHETGLSPNYLELEITENIMQNVDQSATILQQIMDIGVKVSIDDFGTGYSSFNYLKRLPINTIKIDKSFIDDVATNTNERAIVKAIIQMGHNLNFKVVAEGIETKQQEQFLIENKCELGQGYYFSKPLSIKDMTNFLIKVKKS